MINKYVFTLILLYAAASLSSQNQPKVIVIGAGIAGLTTAYRLHSKGIDVEVYEAKNRVGGRIFTALVDGHVAELGGQNIADGGAAENLLALINELDLNLGQDKLSLNLHYFDQTRFLSVDKLLQEKQFSSEALRTMLNESALKAKTLQDVLNNVFNTSDPLNKIMNASLAGYEGASAEKLSPLYVETLYHMLSGGLSFAHDDKNFISHIWIQGGNNLLTEKLAQLLNSRIHKNMPLIAVAKSSRGNYILTFQNGTTAEADILVLAIPCSVYKDISFDSDVIPEKKLRNITMIPYGTNAKIVIPLQCEYKERGPLINDHVCTFFNVDKKIINLYCFGSTGFFSSQTIGNIYKQEHNLLAAGFGEACLPSSTPIIARDEAFGSYEGPLGHSWPNDPFIKGSYSYIAPGQESLLLAMHDVADETVKSLFAPLDKLYFAGEHTSILKDVPGTMEAACESGARTARMIEKLLGSNTIQKDCNHFVEL